MLSPTNSWPATSVRRAHVIAASAALVVAATRAAHGQAGAPVVRFGATPSESFAQGLYAVDAGFFKQAGIVGQPTILPGGGAITSAVISGALDIGLTNAGSMANAHVHGLPFYLIAPSAISGTGPATTALLVPKDSSITSAADFSGKPVALSTIRDLQQVALMTWLDKNGGDSKAVTYLELPTAEQPLALLAKRTAAAVMTEPWITLSSATTRIVAEPYKSLGPQILISGWIANKDWADRNRALVRQVVTALQATAVWANHQPDATAAILEKYTTIAPDVAARMHRLSYGERLDLRLIQPVIDATVRYGFLPRRFSASEMLLPA
jgi:ABC-type nitrate/sulfonate/bicarbonate transport system substrate-binding protein